MIISELTMARLNFANVLTHFSHSGVDEMADNTWYEFALISRADLRSHFDINQFFLDNGLEDGYETKLYFPADCVSALHRLKAPLTLPRLTWMRQYPDHTAGLSDGHSIIDRVFYDQGIRFVFSTRAKFPWILKEDGSKFYGEGYVFQPSKDEYIRKGTKGYIGGLRLPE
jgi:hypothetical protein